MSENYDVIIIGTGAGGGTLAHALAPSGKRSCCWSAAISCPGRWTTGTLTRCSSTGSTSPPTPGTTATAGRSSLRSTISSAGPPSCTGPPCTGCAPRTSGRSNMSTGSPRPGRWLRRLRAVVHQGGMAVPGARQRRRGPDRRSLAQPYPWPAVSHEPRPADSRCAGQGRLPPVPRAGRDHAGRGRRPRSACIRCAWCDGYPCLVHAKADAEVIGVRPVLDRPTSPCSPAEVVKLETDASGRTVTGVVVERDGNREVYRATSWPSAPGPPTAPRSCSTPPTTGTRTVWPTARTRWDATTCSTTARPWPPWARKERDGVPEDPGHQRLLPRHARTTVAAGQHPDDRQVQRRGHEGRGAQAHHVRPRRGPWTTWPSIRWTGGSPPRTCQCPRTG